MKSDKLYIGCSGYATPSWKTLFYPEGLLKKNWFDYYSRQFSTYEFNGTFYRFPTVENLLSWHDRVPGGFKFSIKVPKTITHIKKLERCGEEIEEFYRVSHEGFKDKLACVLWQLPPGFSFSGGRLRSVVNAVKPGFKNVVEFRHESWWREEVLATLRENDITFCNVNYPGLPVAIQRTTSTGYIRMHGNPELFYSEYTREEVAALYHEVSSAGFGEIYIYFNNTASSAAIINALQLKTISKQAVPTPLSRRIE